VNLISTPVRSPSSLGASGGLRAGRYTYRPPPAVDLLPECPIQNGGCVQLTTGGKHLRKHTLTCVFRPILSGILLGIPGWHSSRCRSCAHASISLNELYGDPNEKRWDSSDYASFRLRVRWLEDRRALNDGDGHRPPRLRARRSTTPV